MELASEVKSKFCQEEEEMAEHIQYSCERPNTQAMSLTFGSDKSGTDYYTKESLSRLKSLITETKLDKNALKAKQWN